jgi:phage terminase Nu1 subunit (DNA packaging protein)
MTKKKQTKRIKVSVRRASELFQLDRMTLARRLAVAYPEGRPRNQYTLGEVHLALNSAEQQARTRSAKARADILELKLQEKAARLMPVEEFREGVEDFAKVASEVISTLPGAPEDLKRTLLRHVAGIKKSNLAAVDQLLKDRARRAAAHLAS